MQKSVKGCVKIIYFYKKYFMLKKCYKEFLIECGTDEAGRGCLAGPVTAAAIILQNPNIILTKEEKKLEKLVFKSINDSKQLTEKKRFELRPIIENLFDFAYIHIDNKEIDEINILNASMKAMQESVLSLKTQPEYIIVDGNRPLNGKLGMKQTNGKIFSVEEIEILKSIPNTSIIKGDANYLSIAAASILAKTYRDDFMDKIHEEFPMYNWKKNKGYPTKEHREAIRKHGITKYHRITFRLLPEQLVLDL
jgi:ribonuclease HII